MKNKFYHLSTCSTCKRIIKELGNKIEAFEMQDIKSEKITAVQIDEMAGSYEALFSRRSQQYAALGLKDKTLLEEDYRNFILQEYTFLKRPVAIVGKEIFVGNSADTIHALSNALASL